MKQKKFLKTGAKAKSKFHNENNQKILFFFNNPILKLRQWTSLTLTDHGASRAVNQTHRPIRCAVFNVIWI